MIFIGLKPKKRHADDWLISWLIYRPNQSGTNRRLVPERKEQKPGVSNQNSRTRKTNSKSSRKIF